MKRRIQYKPNGDILRETPVCEKCLVDPCPRPPATAVENQAAKLVSPPAERVAVFVGKDNAIKSWSEVFQR